MTQAKAASLTSALFARKGAASPAGLVIAELEGVDGPLDGAVDGHAGPLRPGRSKERGQGASQRKKANLPEIEQELPLLAFFDVQASDDGALDAAVSESPDGAAEQNPESPAREPAATEPAALSPAASLMTHLPAAFDEDIAETKRSSHGVDETPGETPDEIAPDEIADVVRETGADPVTAEAPPAVTGSPEPIEVAEAVQDGPDNGIPVPEAEEDAQADENGNAEQNAEDAPAAAEVSNGHVAPTPEADLTVEVAAPAASTGDSIEAASPLELNRAVDDLADLKHRETATSPATSPSNPAAWQLRRQRVPLWRMAAVVALGVGLGFAGYSFWPQGTVSPGDEADTVAGPASVAAVAEVTNGQSESASEGGALVANQAVSPAAVGDPVENAGGATDDQPPETADGEAVSAAAADLEPSFDVIRIEPNGQSIIAGRADPLSEWILLNNGQPIGAVQADINGEWVILPGAALIPGANDFSLVRKAERGKVAIPANDLPSVGAAGGNRADEGHPAGEVLLAPRSEAAPPLGERSQPADQIAEAMPLPRLKPGGLGAAMADVRVTPGGRYEIQFASVRESLAAERELERLVTVYPGLLGDLGLRVQEARIDGAGVFYRLRSGPIEDLGHARELCRQMELRGQGCLVVVRTDEGVAPLAAEPPARKPSVVVVTPTQQAENPD